VRPNAKENGHITLLNGGLGALEWRQRSARRPVIAEKSEKREHSHQVGIHLGNPGFNEDVPYGLAIG
jgi:hypothetical protein